MKVNTEINNSPTKYVIQNWINITFFTLTIFTVTHGGWKNAD